jgi:predicted DsbA family dithiol-disulfide isomerase
VSRLIPRLLLAAWGASPNATPNATAAPAPAAAAPAADSSLPDPVATIGGEPVSLAELEKAASAGVIAAKIQEHEARQRALDGLIIERLLEAEAKKRGTDVDGLIKAEVEDKLATPTDAEVEAFYNANIMQMGGAPLEAMKERIAGHLQQSSGQERMTAFLGELKAAASVETHLPAFRVNPAGRDGAAKKGADGAQVHIVEFSDFQCGYCARAAETVEKVVEAYGDKVSFEYRHFPLDFHDRAHRAAEASECARELGNFWGYHDKLFAQSQGFTEEALRAYATELELDGAKFDECLSSGRNKAVVDADMEAGAAVGMSGTPGFYVNGRVISGAQPFEAFKEVIDEELGM